MKIVRIQKRDAFMGRKCSAGETPLKLLMRNMRGKARNEMQLVHRAVARHPADSKASSEPLQWSKSRIIEERKEISRAEKDRNAILRHKAKVKEKNHDMRIPGRGIPKQFGRNSFSKMTVTTGRRWCVESVNKEVQNIPIRIIGRGNQGTYKAMNRKKEVVLNLSMGMPKRIDMSGSAPAS